MAKDEKYHVYAREWRDEKDMTLEQVAKIIGLSVSYLSDLERGHPDKRWNVDHLVDLAKVYDLSGPRDLFRHPKDHNPLVTMVEKLSKDERETAERVLAAITKKAG